MAKLVLNVACMAVLCMLVVAPHAEAADCGRFVSKLAPCINYVLGKAPLAAGCCSAIKALNAAARTPSARQAACNCLKSAANSIKGINFGLAGSLPGKCGVSIGYPISTSVDCSKVH